jgi:hypothetical protein
MLRSLMPLASASASYLGTCPLRSHTELADFRQSDFAGYPVVVCDARASRMSKSYSGVVHDSSETATLAAKELLSLHRRPRRHGVVLRPAATASGSARG